LPDFSWYNKTKMGKMYQTDHKIYQKAIKNIHQMVINYSTPRLSKVYHNWIFWFKNIPSGNPGHHVGWCHHALLCQMFIKLALNRLKNINKFWKNVSKYNVVHMYLQLLAYWEIAALGLEMTCILHAKTKWLLSNS
jgi:hypothetical protein